MHALLARYTLLNCTISTIGCPAQELLDSCKLDEDGKVTTEAKVTELIAESYVAAAQIYLQCRLFRRRRKSPVVQNTLWRLLRTIEIQPTSGLLFTAQTPLFSVFIGGIVAYKSEDRDTIRAWFDPICVGSRGNVPPTYAALKHIWAWLDEYEEAQEEAEQPETSGKREEILEDDTGTELEQVRHEREHTQENSDEVKLDNSDAWWEALVGEISAKYGRLNLA